MTNKIIATVALLSSFTCSTIYAAPTPDKLGMESVYKANDINVLYEHPIEELKSITLTPTVTNKGVLYIEKDKNIVFADVSPVIINKETGKLEGLDRDIVTNYLSTIENKITYKAPNEKAVLTVFSDITCPYCQKVHSEIPTYLANGITVSIILFPRNGLASDAALRMSSIQDSDNPQQTLSGLMDGSIFLPKATKTSTQVEKHFEAGQVMDVTATPVMYLKGVRLNGYIPAKVLIKGL